MSTASKRKGSSWEIALRDWFTEHLGRPVHRLALNGSKDIGDLAVEGWDCTLEAKNCKAITLASFMDETLTEQGHRGTRWCATLIKRAGKGTSAAYVVMPLDQFTDLMEMARRQQLTQELQ